MPSISDALANLNAALTIYLSNLDPAKASDELENAENQLQWNPQPDAWTLSASEIMKEDEVSRALTAASRGMRPDELVLVLSALQRLDEWHSPLTDRGAAINRRGGTDHVAASVRLELEGRMNDVGPGSVVPKRTESWKTCDDHALHDDVIASYGSGGWVKVDASVYRTADLLEWTAYLPPAVLASHQDAGAGADRDVVLRYTRVPADLDVSPPRTGALRIMIAPVLETEDDVDVTGTAVGCSYKVRPSDACDRIDAIVLSALEEGVEVLFMPEMSLSPASLSALSRSLQDRRRAWIADRQSIPPLAWAMAGVMDDGMGEGANYVVVLNADGVEVARQEKISRWNMNADQQAQFDLVPAGGVAVARMDEPIRGASEVLVMDLPGLGRMTILICADMDIALPGNWMFANAGLDMIYAPIMDKTTPLQRGGSVDAQPWIVRRSFRAAATARAKVVMTNSMPLTEIVNRTNASRSSGRPPFATCLVGLLVDGTEKSIPYMEVNVELRAASPIIKTVEWNKDWQPFDLNIA